MIIFDYCIGFFRFSLPKKDEMWWVSVWCSCLDVRRSLTLLRWDSLPNPTDARTVSCWPAWGCWGAAGAIKPQDCEPHHAIDFQIFRKSVGILKQNIMNILKVATHIIVQWERSFCKVALDFSKGSSSTSWAQPPVGEWFASHLYLGMEYHWV